MSKKAHLLVAAMALALVVLPGCEPEAPKPQPKLAPAKPLTAQQESLLQEIEAAPQDKRQSIVNAHVNEVMAFSADNRNFGERLNAAMGAAPAAK